MASHEVQGSIFKWNSATVGEVRSASGGSAARATIDIGSWADTIVMRRAGRRNLGTYTITVNWNGDDATHTALLADWAAKTQRTAIFTLPTGTKNDITCLATVENFTMGSQGEDSIHTAQITICVQSTPTRN